jgi:hypothetical protein
MLNDNITQLLDNNGILLYLLREKGQMRFNEIVNVLDPYEKLQGKPSPKKSSKQTGVPGPIGGLTSKFKPRRLMSRGTINKRLKFLKNPIRHYVEQVSEMDSVTLRSIQKYQLTQTGRAHINQILRDEEISVRPDQFGIFYQSIMDFFQKRGFDQDLYLPRVINMIARIDSVKFFQLQQTDELMYTFLFIFQNMLEYRDEKLGLLFFELDKFCEHYSVSQVDIQYHLKKIKNAELGFYTLNWDDNLLFFQRNDIIGAVLFNLIKNALEVEIIKKSLHLKEDNTFDTVAKSITDRMIQLNLIRPRIEASFKLFVKSMLIVTAIERGLSRFDLVEFWPLFNDLLNSKNGITITEQLFGTRSEIEKIDIVQESFKLKLEMI